MTRGKPCAEQLDLSNDLLTNLGPTDYKAADGTDARNYGGVDGLPEAKALFADFMEVSPKEVLIGDNSSLSLMHDAVARALSHGVPGGEGPWSSSAPKFLCPAPGYDRHFTICQHFGVEMLVVDMTRRGSGHGSCRGARRDGREHQGYLAGAEVQQSHGRHVLGLRRAAAREHEDRRAGFPGLLGQCLRASPPDRPAAEALEPAPGVQDGGQPGSRLPVRIDLEDLFAGGGIAVMAGSERNMAWMRDHRSKSTIGPDKINQLRHVRFFRDMDGITAHMKKHAAILRPKFDLVDEILRRELGESGVATWTRPLGGYFTSLDTPDGCARAVVKMAAEAGVKLTEAGATFPYGRDPRDRNIRIAPSLPKLDEIGTAMEVLAVCVKRVALQQYAG